MPTAAAKAASVELAVEGMTCGSCVGRVERALKGVPGVTEATVNLATERATVAGAATAEALIAAVERVGYEARALRAAVPGDEQDAQRAAKKDAERRDLRRDLIVAAFLTAPVFVMEMGSHLIPGLHHAIAMRLGMQTSWIIQFALTTLVMFVPGLRFYRQGLPALAHLAPDMNSLVAVGSLAAWGYSIVATFAPGVLPAGATHVY